MDRSTDNTQDKKPAARPSLPEFRSVAIQRPTSLAGPSLRSSGTDVIDKSSYFAASLAKVDSKPQSATSRGDSSKSNWTPTELRPVPAFYPLERSSRFVEDDLSSVVSRVSEANRLLSIHAMYCNKTATADLYTSDNVEMYLSLWKTSGKQQGIVVEIQRRKGCSISFHRYSRCILDAAVGELDIHDHVEKNGEDLDLIYSKKLMCLEIPKDAGTETENAIVAVEIAHGLLMKDRMDARQLGLESLCLLTDPRKTGNTTALLASRVVLLGTTQDVDSPPEEGLIVDETPFQEIRQTILSLIQFRRIGDADEFEESDENEEEECITVLHNLALAVLANALDVISNEEILEDESSSEEEVITGRSRLDTSESISERFLEDSLECSDNLEIMKTLISELGKAGMKPHNACLSAKCIGSLCKASQKAKGRAKELGAKQTVQKALEVGTRTHLKLERECSKVMTELQTESATNTDDAES